MNPIPALSGLRVVSLAINLPGPVAAHRLWKMGAVVVKVEPPSGDPLAVAAAGLYAILAAGQTVHQIDLKSQAGRARLEELLASADLLLTSSRPAALARLGVTWESIQARFPRLCWTAIVGHLPPHEDRPGHDLTYVAEQGLLSPPQMPRTLVADLGGAQEAVRASLALLLRRERTGESGQALVALAEAASAFALPLKHGLTASGSLLGGGLAGYKLYETADGWIALAALEPHFWQRVLDGLQMASADADDLAARFRQQPTGHWLQWANEHDIPLAPVPQVP